MMTTQQTHAVPPRTECRVKQVGLTEDFYMVGATLRALCTAELNGDELSLL